MSSLVLVRNQSVVDDADEHQEPKQDDEDREHPAFGQTIAPQFLNNNLRMAVGLSRCGQREEAVAPNSSATSHSIVITTAKITRGATNDVHRASADGERFILPGRPIISKYRSLETVRQRQVRLAARVRARARPAASSRPSSSAIRALQTGS